MRALAVLFAACVLVGCGSEQPPGSQTKAATTAPVQKGATDPTVQLLLVSSAKDFHDHQPPYPAQFRNVRAGRIIAPAGKTQHFVCGQFLPKQEKGEWTSFATIKTSGYEQLIGSQAEGDCKQTSIVWDEGEDLSASLQSQFDALR